MGVITIGAKDFVRGISSSNDIPDGGGSPVPKGYNLDDSPGALGSKAAGTDMSDNLTYPEDVIAYTPDVMEDTTNTAYFVTTNGAYGANFFKWTGTSSQPTEEKTDTGASTRTYIAGKTDMIMYKNYTYVTSNVDIAQLDNNLNTLDEDWWTNTEGEDALEGSYVHPMIVFDKKLWIADKAALHDWDGSTSTSDVIDFGYGRVITALGRDEKNGDMLIGVATSGNISGIKGYINKMLIWDGFSTAPSREIIVDGMITAFKNVGGITYVCYDDNFGYYNGSGITFLRKLEVSFNNESLIYPHKITSIGDTIYIAETENILAYGKVRSGGNKVFYYPYFINPAATGQISIIAKVTPTKLAYAYRENNGGNEAQYFNYLDLTDFSDGGNWYSNKYYLPSNSRVVKIEAIVRTMAGGNINFNLLNLSTESFDSFGQISFSTDGVIEQKTMGRNKKFETPVVQLQIAWSGDQSIKQVKIYYEPIEKEV